VQSQTSDQQSESQSVALFFILKGPFGLERSCYVAYMMLSSTARLKIGNSYIALSVGDFKTPVARATHQWLHVTDNNNYYAHLTASFPGQPG